MASAPTALLHARITSGLRASTAASERPHSDNHRWQAVVDLAAVQPPPSWGLHLPAHLKGSGVVLGTAAKTSPLAAMLSDR